MDGEAFHSAASSVIDNSGNNANVPVNSSGNIPENSVYSSAISNIDNSGNNVNGPENSLGSVD